MRFRFRQLNQLRRRIVLSRELGRCEYNLVLISRRQWNHSIMPLAFSEPLTKATRFMRAQKILVGCLGGYRDFITISHSEFGGKGGIRTHGRDEPYTGFRVRRFRPLSHLSVEAKLYLRRRRRASFFTSAFLPRQAIAPLCAWLPAFPSARRLAPGALQLLSGGCPGVWLHPVRRRCKDWDRQGAR